MLLSCNAWYCLGNTCCSHANAGCGLGNTCGSHAMLGMVCETHAALMQCCVWFGKHMLLSCNAGYGLGDTCCSHATLGIVWETHAALMQCLVLFLKQQINLPELPPERNTTPIALCGKEVKHWELYPSKQEEAPWRLFGILNQQILTVDLQQLLAPPSNPIN